jgi:DNA-binding transcriptional LysR family regulator
MTDPRLLRYFVAVAEELHFGRAARRLHIKQPPLSQAIQKLERELGLQLFVRSRRSVELTEAGFILLDAAKRVIAQHEQFANTADLVKTGEVGWLRIGYTLSMPFLPEFITALRRTRVERPEISFELKNISTRAGMQSLIDDQLDIALVRSVRPVAPSLESFAVARDRLKLILPKQHRLAHKRVIALCELADEPFIQRVRQQHTEFHEFLQKAWLKECSNPRQIIEAGDTPAVMALVAAGLGFSILPSTLQAISITGLIWCDIAGRAEDLVSTILAVYRPSQGSNPVLEQFIGLIRSAPESLARPA